MLSTDPNAKQKIEDMIAWYESLKKMTPQMLCYLWQEETEEEYNEMLECLPPLVWKDGAFMVGECSTHSQYGAIYDLHIEIDEKYFWRPAYAHTFDPASYRAEVRVKFYGQCFSCGYPLDVNGMCTAPLSNAD